MKILHISAANETTGAGIACVRLHENLLLNGIDSKILFINKINKNQKNYFSIDNNIFNSIKRKLYTFLDNCLKYYYNYDKRKYFSVGFFGFNLNTIIDSYKCDVIHLHWINHGFIKTKTIFDSKIPIIWTMHDCWTFTGGCHHFYSCSNFQRNCGTCEVLDSSNTKDLSSYMYCIKSRAYNKNTTFVAISDWMLNSAKKSTLLKDKNIIKIVSGINTNIFKYIDRNYARETENFDFNSKIVLIGAQSLNSLSKGFDFTIQALNKFNKYPLTILAFGDGDIVLKNPLHKIINLGYINNPYKMANIFSMSDIFISTAVVESFGMAIAEAQCCGLPAIIFDNTGPVEIVDNMKTGYIAKHSDVDDIINGINFCFNYKFNRSNISSNSINKFSINITTKEYIYEYNKLVTNNKL